MSAPIGSSTTAGAAQARVGSSVGASSSSSGGSRPQVQSRRVSLKLGPLGITYSTDKVLWTEAVAAATASAVGGDEALAVDKSLASDAAPVDSVRGLPAGAGSGQDAAAAGQAQQTAQEQQAAAAGRSFHLELAEAWRRQIEARAAASQTYGPDGTPRNAASSASSSPGAVNVAQATAATAAASASAASSAISSTPDASSAAAPLNAETPPAARMRRAIGAYLACAREFSAARPMLTAVA
jgi:hypothetical protein